MSDQQESQPGAVDPPVYTVSEFCAAHRISRAAIYEQWQAGIGPRCMRNGTRRLITAEAAQEWRAARTADVQT
jgi:hypothetical protein